MIDITNENAILLDGKTIPVEIIRTLAVARMAHIRIETDRGDVSETEVEHHEGGAITFRRRGGQGQVRGNDARPVETLALAEMRDADRSQRRWAVRGSAAHRDLVDAGWTESGSTKAKDGEK